MAIEIGIPDILPLFRSFLLNWILTKQQYPALPQF